MFSLASKFADFPPFTYQNAGHPPRLVWLSRQNIVELLLRSEGVAREKSGQHFAMFQIHPLA